MSGYITGTVTDSGANAIEGATVSVTLAGGSTVYTSTTTGSNGNYTLNLDDKTWDVHCEAVDYEPAEVESVTVNGDTSQVDFVLDRRAHKVQGELDDGLGRGVVGRNTADTGTPIGVQGLVPNASEGYGFSTPHDARIEGAIDTDGTDFAVETDEYPSFAGNVVMGHASNEVVNDARAATIGGGGRHDNTSTAYNSVAGDSGTVGGGTGNEAGDTSRQAHNVYGQTIAGGVGNTAKSTNASVGGGWLNEALGGYSTVSGGAQNDAVGSAAAIGGGFQNLVEGDQGIIAGGGPSDFSNQDTTKNAVYDDYGAVGGGGNNQAGVANTSGTEHAVYATVPGGRANTASGSYSFAAGRGAEAGHDGAFVWSDSGSGTFASDGADQFLVDASGGVGLGTTPAAPLDVRSGNNWDLDNPGGDFKIGDDGYRFKLGVATGGGGAGAVNMRAQGGIKKLKLGSGGSEILTVQEPDGVYPHLDDTFKLGRSGNRWTEIWATNGTVQTSDARLKNRVSDLDEGLERVRDLRPVTFEWADEEEEGATQSTASEDDESAQAVEESDRGAADGASNLGLIAQEVRETVPEAVVEPDGDGYLGVNYESLVPLLVGAVQEQAGESDANAERVDELETEVGALRATVEDLAAENESLRKRLAAREERIDGLTDRVSVLESQRAPAGQPADD